MAAPTETYIDPADGAAAGNDHGGNAFVDGSFANATLTLTRVGAFTAATCQGGDKIYLDDNGSGEVAAGLYTINARVDDDNVTLTADIRSGAPDPVDVRCDQHTGAVGLPWATVQHALDFTTRDAVDGDRFNVKAGTDDVLAAALDFTTYGTPTGAAPWVMQGYTAAAGDGGIGGVSGNANFSIFASAALDYIYLIDMHLHNCGAANIVHLDDYIYIVNCELDNTTGTGIDIDRFSLVLDCHVHNIDTDGVYIEVGSIVANCTLENGTNDFGNAIALATGTYAIGNVIDIDGTSIGIRSWGASTHVLNNSIFSSSGTGNGIQFDANFWGSICWGNIIEGFSGIGGNGISIAAGTNILALGYNAFYNNTTNLNNAGILYLDWTAQDQALTASPFIDAASDDFRVNASVRALAYPTGDYPNLSVRSYLDIGALQRMEIAGPALRGRNILLRM